MIEKDENANFLWTKNKNGEYLTSPVQCWRATALEYR